MSIFATSTAAFYDRSTQSLSALRGQAEGLQNQISTNSKLTKSSDDPLAASQLRALARADALGTIDTAATNRATTDLNLTDTALGQFANYVSRAQELATQAASALLPATQRASIASELAQIHTGLVGLANARDSAGHALFGGDSAGDAYEVDSTTGLAKYIGSGSSGQLSLGDGQTVGRSLTGPEFLSFKDPAGNSTDLMAVIKNLSDVLSGGSASTAATAQAALGSLANGLDAITTAQTVIGSRLSWIDLSTERQQAMGEARASQQQDIGAPELGSAIARLQQLSTVLEASQASFSKLAGLSLFDFLR
ncbi:flagellar biosynthesis protein FlgL [Novosphingobium fuchskuhlense]|uniref:Flagellar biosynthesis protein FlgL n=1 Tax=Novosphingobium fuchskuhlense TaxID=1117702 RepID=A0A117UXM0_9SPHN|nr:flagellar biosynthesis protein FlgL [Novosphingobium fuchskuhlense]KUR72728.1 flagellar biosynthesis protein FlgL [Novosphingobium fuchskuhlense]